MPNFISHILKQKKTLIFILLSLIIISFLSPHVALAVCALGQFSGFDVSLGRERCGPLSDVQPDGIKFNLSSNAWTWEDAFLIASSKLILVIAWRSAVFSADLVSYVFTNILNKPITTDGRFVPAWADVRNLGNMFIVLGFIVVGISTALRIREYEAKKLLWPLILVALLINFSGLFCGFIIDTAEMVITGLSGSGTSSIGYSILTDLVRLSASASRSALGPINTPTPNSASYASTAFYFALIYFAVGFTFFYLTIVLMARYAILIILFILSPLAFAFWIFPASKHLWTSWWNHFLKWVFVGVPAVFFLWVARVVLTVPKPDIYTYIITLMFLFIGFKITAGKTGIASMAATAAIGLATGGASLAMKGAAGAGKMAGKGADAATGGYASRGANKMKNMTGNALERLGLKQKGSTAGAASGEIEAKQKSVANLSLAQQAKMAKGSASTHNAVQDKIASIQNLAKTGNLNELGDINAQKQAMSYVESYEKSRGYSSNIRKEASKTNPNLAENPQKLAEAVRKTSADKAAEWHPSVVTPEVFSNMSKNQFDTINRKGSPGLNSIIEAFANSGSDEHKKLLTHLKNNPSAEQGAMSNIRYIQGQGTVAEQPKRAGDFSKVNWSNPEITPITHGPGANAPITKPVEGPKLGETKGPRLGERRGPKLPS